MVDIRELFTENTLRLMRTEIADTGGNEVFFIGRFDSSGMIGSLVPAARGNRYAVPAPPSAADRADILVHNHPSGTLEPSDADLSIAARYSEQGTGFCIIDNDCRSVYVVVEPFLAPTERPIDPDEISSLLGPEGPFARDFSAYETRPSQLELCAAISRVFNTGSVGVFEAGTGVGKSFAYLLPALRWAVQNRDRVIISTGTINLQQQLADKDIPRAISLTGEDISFIMLKGRQNYLCRRRLADALMEQDLFSDEKKDVKAIADWADVTRDGSRSDLTFVPADGVWSRVCSESDACMGMRCAFHETCFVMQIRKAAAGASVLVVNHHLLFSDLEIRMAGLGYEDTAVLPPFRNIIFDEAHGMEAAATSFFSETITRYKIQKQISVLYRVKKGSVAGHLLPLTRMSRSDTGYSTAVAQAQEIRTAYSTLEDIALELIPAGSSWRLTDSTAGSAGPLLVHMAEIRRLIAAFTGTVRSIIDGIDEGEQNDPVVWEAKFALRRLEFAGSLAQHFCEWQERRESVYWLERVPLSSHARSGQDGDRAWYPRFTETPLSVASMMNSGVFEPLRTVVCTSATLRTGDSFQWWLTRTGAALCEEDRLCTGIYDSPFPYKRCALLAIPSEGPLPDEDGFQDWVQRSLVDLLAASAGHSLVLFTSYESLRSACAYIRSTLGPSGMTILRQGEDDRARLLEQFKKDESSVLFATDSFWEGIDAPGDTLLQVILVKLPFRVPNDPVFAARSEAVEKKGGNAFMDLSLPEAVIKFRQGFGRLIRSKTDRGVVTVLDRRIAVKRYGRMFVSSIPEVSTCVAPVRELAERIETFLYP